MAILKRKLCIISVVAISLMMAFSTATAGEKVLRIRQTYDVQGFDPGKYTLHNTSVVLRMVYDNLVDYQVGNWPMMYNQLAEKYEVSNNGKLFTFYLKKGVPWQKGFGEVTAEDVKFSVERVMDPANKAPMRSVWDSVVDKIETPDKYTVKFHLKNPDPAFLAKLAPWRPGPIVCKKAVEKYGKDYAATVDKVVGCGPFEVAEWIPGQKVVLERFENYHGVKPKLDRIELLVITDESTAILSAQKGELDLVPLFSSESLETVRKDKNLKLYTGISPLTRGFVVLNTEHPILKDVRVRRALVHALDRDLIAESVGAGRERACGLLAPGAYWGAIGCDELPKYPYDVKKAKALLAEAGYPKGFKLQYIELNTQGHRDLGPVLQSFWKEVGVETELEFLPVKEWLAKLQNSNFASTKFTMGTRPSEPSIFLHSTMHSTSSKPGLNGALYKGVDDLLDRALATSDLAERKELYARIQKKIIEDCVIIPIFFDSQQMAVRSNIDLGAGAKGDQLTCPYNDWYWIEVIDIR